MRRRGDAMAHRGDELGIAVVADARVLVGRDVGANTACRTASPNASPPAYALAALAGVADGAIGGARQIFAAFDEVGAWPATPARPSDSAPCSRRARPCGRLRRPSALDRASHAVAGRSQAPTHGARRRAVRRGIVASCFSVLPRQHVCGRSAAAQRNAGRGVDRIAQRRRRRRRRRSRRCRPAARRSSRHGPRSSAPGRCASCGSC